MPRMPRKPRPARRNRAWRCANRSRPSRPNGGIGPLQGALGNDEIVGIRQVLRARGPRSSDIGTETDTATRFSWHPKTENGVRPCPCRTRLVLRHGGQPRKRRSSLVDVWPVPSLRNPRARIGCLPQLPPRRRRGVRNRTLTPEAAYSRCDLVDERDADRLLAECEPETGEWGTPADSRPRPVYIAIACARTHVE